MVQFTGQELLKIATQTDYHKEALKSDRLRALPPEKVHEETPMGIMIPSANEKLANKMGALMLQVYNIKYSALFTTVTLNGNQLLTL